MNLARNPLCDCGEVDTPAHMLYHCGVYQDTRDTLREVAETAGLQWPVALTALTSRDLYPAFQEAAAEMMARKRELWLHYNFE